MYYESLAVRSYFEILTTTPTRLAAPLRGTYILSLRHIQRAAAACNMRPAAWARNSMRCPAGSRKEPDCWRTGSEYPFAAPLATWLRSKTTSPWAGLSRKKPNRSPTRDGNSIHLPLDLESTYLPVLEIRATIIITSEIAPHVGARHIPTHSSMRLEQEGNDGISMCHDLKREDGKFNRFPNFNRLFLFNHRSN